MAGGGNTPQAAPARPAAAAVAAAFAARCQTVSTGTLALSGTYGIARKTGSTSWACKAAVQSGKR
jgi:hypothetical protein